MSAYAEELKKQSLLWRFPRAIELEFGEYQGERDLKRARSGLVSLLCLVAAMATVYSILTPAGFTDPSNVLRLAGIGLPVALGLGATYWRVLRGTYQWVLAGVIIVASTNSILIALMTANAGALYYSSGLLVLMLVNYFVMGFGWRMATAVGVVVLGVFTAANLLTANLGVGFASNFIFLAFANGVGTLGAHQRSQSRRRTFLESRIVEQLSGLDQLTGVNNRRRLDEEMDLYWRRAKRANEPLSIALIDIDYFKRYNDHLGHQAGDSCLREVAQMISKQARDTDFAGRYGGEEFALLLPRTDSDGASILAERLLKAIAAEDIPHPASSVASHVTVSVGVATVWPDGTDRSLQGFIQMADEALYEAKGAGRNTIVTCTDENKLVSTGVFTLRPMESLEEATVRMRRDN